MVYALKGKRVWVTGHTGMVGGALVRRLTQEGCHVFTTTRSEVDLTRQIEVENWLADNKPDAVFVAAGKVGGIEANRSYPVDFLYENLMIGANIIHGAHKFGVEKLLYLASSCSYPKKAEQPVAEESLLTGPLEPTNEWYAVAKISGIKLCEAYRRQYGCDYISVVPNNAYGPGDNFHPAHSHVPASLLKRFHEAKEDQTPEVVVWGSGKPRREFLFVDDIADACVFLMNHYSEAAPINISTGESVSIKEFAEAIAETVGYNGNLVFDTSYPDGMMRKELDTSKLTKLGWTVQTPLKEGLQQYYTWFLNNQEKLRA